jgi:hypothetical protein
MGTSVFNKTVELELDSLIVEVEYLVYYVSGSFNALPEDSYPSEYEIGEWVITKISLPHYDMMLDITSNSLINVLSTVHNKTIRAACVEDL